MKSLKQIYSGIKDQEDIELKILIELYKFDSEQD